MKSKFWFLIKTDVKKKICTKSFKIINVIFLILIVALFNLQSIVKFFGGDFNDPTKIYIKDEINVYDNVDNLFKTSYKEILDQYNIAYEKSDKDIKELKKEIEKNESKDIVVHYKNNKEGNLEVEIISYDYLDMVIYQTLTTSINTVKSNLEIKKANIDPLVLEKISKGAVINRTILDQNKDESQEVIEKIGGIIILVFIVPFFLLIVLIIQMIGGSINEEKSTKSMEIIISSISPKIHFLSKIISANLFALLQGFLVIVYSAIGIIVKVLISGSILNTAAINTDSVGGYINMFLESDLANRILVASPIFIILMILSLLAYSLFIGILASVTTSMEDYSQIQSPVMVFLMIGYYLAIYASTFQGATFIKVAAYIPFISGILAPVMYTIKQFTMTDLLISTSLLILTCFLLFKYGLKVYKEGILNYSSTKLWSKLFNALKK